MKLALLLTGTSGLFAAALPALATVTPDHIVVVVEENHGSYQIKGSPNAPYENSLFQQGLYYANSHGTDHDSQPNYLELFAGENLGIHGVAPVGSQRYPTGLTAAKCAASQYCQDGLNNSDNQNAPLPFNGTNLYTSLTAAGKAFAGYSQSQPTDGFTGNSFGGRLYRQKHNPWAQYQGAPGNVTAAQNLTFADFQNTSFASLPNVSFVVPDQYHDDHDTVCTDGLPGPTCTDATTIQNGDNWLQANIDPYLQWAKMHNSLLVVTYDENDYDFSYNNPISTVILGASDLVQPGVNTAYVNHYDLLKYFETVNGGACTNLACTTNGLYTNGAGALAAPEPAAFALFGLGLAALVSARRRRAA